MEATSVVAARQSAAILGHGRPCCYTSPGSSSSSTYSYCSLSRPVGGMRVRSEYGSKDDMASRVSSAADNVKKSLQRSTPTGSNISNNGSLSTTALREAVDKSTKQELSRSDIERHQADDSSEKQSVLGTKPASTVPWPRPELERRPETGDRSLASLFAVDGAAPETINGRMAMVGFVWAVVAEKMTGLTVMEQLFNPGTSGLLYFAGVVQLFTLASLIPFVNGESTDARRWGPFTAKAERWNGRLAMIGFAALLIDEAFRQAPLFGGGHMM